MSTMKVIQMRHSKDQTSLHVLNKGYVQQPRHYSNRIIIGPRFASASNGSSPRPDTTTRCFSQHMELLERMHYLHRLPHYTPS